MKHRIRKDVFFRRLRAATHAVITLKEEFQAIDDGTHQVNRPVSRADFLNRVGPGSSDYERLYVVQAAPGNYCVQNSVIGSVFGYEVRF